MDMLSMENVRFDKHAVWTLDANKKELTRLGFSPSCDSLLRDEAVTLDGDLLRPLVSLYIMILLSLFLTIQVRIVYAG